MNQSGPVPLPAPDSAVHPAPRAGGRPVIWGAAAGLLALHAALAWYLRAPGISTGNDDAVYLLLARSLRNWGYGDLFYVGAPTESQYPPLYPAFLALLGSLFGERVTLFLAANVMLSVAGLALLFDVVRRQNPIVALLTLAVTAINPLLLSLAGGVRSEPLFMALAALSLWLLSRPAPSRPAEIGAGAAAIGAALCRSAAVTLVLGVGLFWLLRRRWGAVALLGLASALTVGSWLVWTVVAPRQLPGRSYVADATYARTLPATPDTGGQSAPTAPPAADSADAVPDSLQESPPAPQLSSDSGPLSVLGQRVRNNVPVYSRILLETIGVPALANTRVDSLGWLLLLMTLGAAGIWGVGRWWMAAVLALCCHGLLLALWPYTMARYLAPLLPLIVLVVFWGAREAEEWTRRRRPGLGPRNILVLGLGVGILVGAVPRMVGQLKTAARCRIGTAVPFNRCTDPVERAFYEAAAYIMDSTPDSARFLTAKEAAFYYYTGRQAVPIYEVAAGRLPDLREYLSRNRAEYVFLSHLKIDEWALARPLLGMCREIELVRSWGSTTLLLRMPRHAVAPERDACGAIRDYAVAPWGNRR